MLEAPGFALRGQAVTELLLFAISQQNGGGDAPSSGAGGLGNPMVMMVLMFVVIYFMMIRPQQKRQKAHDAFLTALKNGDKVVTNGGIYGAVVGLTDDVATLEIAKNTRIRINRSQIAGQQQKAETKNAEPGADKKKAKAG